jgi:hypothetical protein
LIIKNGLAAVSAEADVIVKLEAYEISLNGSSCMARAYEI